MAEPIHNLTRSLVTTAANVRALTGWTSTSDVSDTDLEACIRRAQAHVMRRVAAHALRLPLTGQIDASNTRYRLPQTQPYRVIFDASLDLTTDASDVLVELRTDPTGTDDHPTWATATVSAIDPLHGIVTLASAPAATVTAVEFTGWLTANRLDLEQFRETVELYTAVLVQRRAEDTDKTVLANPEAGKDPTGRGGYQTLYKDSLRALRPAAPRSASVRTSLPGAEW